MRVQGEFVLREIAGDYILVPIGPTALEMNGMITVNEVGATIWKCLEQSCSYNELVGAIMDEYDVEEGEAKRALDEFLKQMRKANLISD